MPTVDFTLDELIDATGKQTRQILREEFEPLFIHAFEPYALAIQQDFNIIHGRLDGLEGEMKLMQQDIKGIHHEMKGVKQVVNHHSVEILELKARPV